MSKVSNIALQQAQELTHELVNGLKALNQSIKLYTERLLEAGDIQAILNQVFDRYQVDVLGEQYYRLKTSEHISKYRTGILQRVREWQSNRTEVLNQASLMIEERQATDRLLAENTIYEWLEFIETSFETMDNLLQEIDRRNAQYARAAAERLRFQLHQGRGVEHHLSVILAYLANLARESSERTAAPEEITNSITLFPQGYVDEFSLKSPPSASKSHSPEPLSVVDISDAVRKAKLSRFGSRLAQEITVEHINRYIDEVLGSRETCPLDELPFNTREQWVKLIYMILYSHSRRANYRLEGSRGETIVVRNKEIEVPKQVITRRGQRL